ARRWMGPRVWQALHASIIVVYVLSVWHTLLYGTNVWYDGAFRTTIWLLQLPVAGLILVRLLAPARTPGRSVLAMVGRWVGRLAGPGGRLGRALGGLGGARRGPARNRGRSRRWAHARRGRGRAHRHSGDGLGRFRPLRGRGCRHGGARPPSPACDPRASADLR